MKIQLKSSQGSFSVVAQGGGYSVIADDDDDAQLAALAQRHAAAMTRLQYTPDLGEPYALFAKIAAKHLRAKIVGGIPPGQGELEQSGDYDA